MSAFVIIAGVAATVAILILSRFAAGKIVQRRLRMLRTSRDFVSAWNEQVPVGSTVIAPEGVGKTMCRAYLLDIHPFIDIKYDNGSTGTEQLLYVERYGP